MQIAIADSNNRVHLWCDNVRTYDNGKTHFSVINGCWDGWIKDDEVYVKYTSKSFFGNKIVWQGFAPYSDYDYNEAMAWIQESVTASGGRVRDYIHIPSRAKIPEEWEDDIPF